MEIRRESESRKKIHSTLQRENLKYTNRKSRQLKKYANLSCTFDLTSPTQKTVRALKTEENCCSISRSGMRTDGKETQEIGADGRDQPGNSSKAVKRRKKGEWEK